MMKIWIVFLSAFLAVSAVFSAEKASPSECGEWDLVTVTFIPGVQQSANSLFNTRGVRLGLPFGCGASTYVAGVEAAIFGGLSKTIYGVQAAFLFNHTDSLDGLQASLFYNRAKSVGGVQLGLVNVAKDVSFQIGLVNVIEDSPVKVFPFINVRFVK